METELHTLTHRICHPGQESDSSKLDREFQNLIPPLSRSELADLHASLDSEGCRDALIVWRGHDTLVDGHNRIKYCREKGYPFGVIEKEFSSRDEVKAFIINTQLGRRNLSPAAESYLRGKRYLETKRQGARTDLDGTFGQNDRKSTAERLGEELKVGERTIRRDGKFAEAVDRIAENCGPDARNLILSRETGLTRGGVLRLAKLKPDEQKKFIEELKTSGKRPRKPRRAKRRQMTTLPSQPKALVQALLKQLGAEEVAEVARGLALAIAGAAGQGVKAPKGDNGPKRRAKEGK
jgi:hypothetical protein